MIIQYMLDHDLIQNFIMMPCLCTSRRSRASIRLLLQRLFEIWRNIKQKVMFLKHHERCARTTKQYLHSGVSKIACTQGKQRSARMGVSSPWSSKQCSDPRASKEFSNFKVSNNIFHNASESALTQALRRRGKQGILVTCASKDYLHPSKQRVLRPSASNKCSNIGVSTKNSLNAWPSDNNSYTKAIESARAKWALWQSMMKVWPGAKKARLIECWEKVLRGH